VRLQRSPDPLAKNKEEEKSKKDGKGEDKERRGNEGEAVRAEWE